MSKSQLKTGDVPECCGGCVIFSFERTYAVVGALIAKLIQMSTITCFLGTERMSSTSRGKERQSQSQPVARLRLCSLSQHHHHDAAKLPTPRPVCYHQSHRVSRPTLRNILQTPHPTCSPHSHAPPSHTRQIQPRDALDLHHALRAWLCRPWKGSRPVSRSDLSSARIRMKTALVQ
jgi:hypothetical protein